jgi:hypothetical protein
MEILPIPDFYVAAMPDYYYHEILFKLIEEIGERRLLNRNDGN